jgi:hypothetical protein
MQHNISVISIKSNDDAAEEMNRFLRDLRKTFAEGVAIQGVTKQ